MKSQHLVVQALAVAGNVAWFGGLVRLIGEGAFRALLVLQPQGIQNAAWISIGIALVLTVVVLAPLLPWYRRTLRQTREDLAAYYGTSAPRASRSESGPRRVGLIVTTLFGAATLSMLLPGFVAAAISIAVGLALRLTILTLV